MANHAKIVSLIDVSVSMSSYDYITAAKSDLDTFINMFQPNDEFSVVSFETHPHYTYPTTANLAVYDDPSKMSQASAAIQALTAYGSSTNIGDAIITGSNLLNPKAEPRGIVLLSDGMWNDGPDPLDVLPDDIRIYTIALGNHGQLDLLRQISAETQGQYFYTPDEIGLASIYFDILEYGAVGQVVNNAFKTVPDGGSLRIPVKLSSGLDSASIGVNWADPSITYNASGGAPQGNQVSVRILDPDFKVANPPVTDRDYGFVVFTLDQPKGGTWYFDCFYHGSGSCNMTVGALDPDLVGNLELTGPSAVVAAGTPAALRARLAYDGEAVKDAAISATVEAPAVSTEEALERHAEELATVALPEEDADKANADLLRLSLLRRQKLPYVDLVPRYTAPAQIRPADDGGHEIVVHTDKPGEYTVRVDALGRHPNGSDLARTKRFTVSVR